MQPKRDLDSGGAYASEITTVDDEAGHGGVRRNVDCLIQLDLSSS